MSSQFKTPKGRVGLQDIDKDWKFWVGILAVVSIGTSVLSAQNGGYADGQTVIDNYSSINNSGYI